MIDVHQEGQIVRFKRIWREEEQLIYVRIYLKINSLFKTKSYKRLNSIFLCKYSISCLKYKSWQSFKDLLPNFARGLSFCFFSNALFNNLIDMKKLNTQMCFDSYLHMAQDINAPDPQ